MLQGHQNIPVSSSLELGLYINDQTKNFDFIKLTYLADEGAFNISSGKSTINTKCAVYIYFTSTSKKIIKCPLN